MADKSERTPFQEKLDHWRKNGGLPVKYQGGRKFWGDTTIKTEQEKIIAQGKAKGRDLVPYNSVFPK